MEFFAVIAMVLATASFSGCDSSTLGRVSSLGSGSYTDSLLGSRFASRAHARPGLGAIAVTQLDACDGLCPIGTICALDIGVPRCVANTGVAVVDTGYGSSNIGLTGSYGAGVGLTSGVASIGIGNKARFVDNGFGSNFGISTCGTMAPECIATRRDFDPVYKYTFDHTLNRCVRVSVCMTCANFNSVRDNLFNSRLQCTRVCQ